jgi:hypothetical protein
MSGRHRSRSKHVASWRGMRQRLLSITPSELKQLVNAAVKKRESNARRARMRSRSRQRVRSNRKDIGVFEYAHDGLASDWLATDGDTAVDPACMLACVERAGGRTLTAVETTQAPAERVLCAAMCEKLVSIVDAAWRFSTAASRTSVSQQHTDYKLPMEAAALERTIGEDAYATLQELLGADPDDVVLRRTQGHGQWINFHVDEAQTTIQVPLRSDDACVGGRLVFIGPKGEPVLRPRHAGVPLIHDGDCVHGVTRLGDCDAAGSKPSIRYGLFLRKL